MTVARLNLFQRLVRGWEAVHPYNAAQAMRLARPVSASAAQTAWTAALAALGLGRVRIEGRAIQYELLNGDAFAYAVRELPRGADLAGHLSAELNRPFNDPQEPPFRPFLLHESETSVIGLVYRHWVADSVSIRLLMEAWFNFLFDPAYAPRNAGRGAAPGYWELFGPRHADGRLGAVLLGGFRSHMRFRRVLKARTLGRDDYPVGVLLRAAPPGLIARVKGYAKSRSVTVGDVLLAALAEAAGRHVPLQARPNRRDLAIGNIVDLRPYARRNLTRSFGLYLGFAQVFCRPNDLRSWERLLASVSTQNRARRREGVAQASAAWMAAALALEPVVKPDRLHHFYRKEIPLTAGLSNVNLANTWPANAQPEPPIEYLRVSPTGPMTPVVLSATTLESRLQLALTYRTSLLTKAAAGAMLDDVLGRLARCCGFEG